jgi:hypothetical protein
VPAIKTEREWASTPLRLVTKPDSTDVPGTCSEQAFPRAAWDTLATAAFAATTAELLIDLLQDRFPCSRRKVCDTTR